MATDFLTAAERELILNDIHDVVTDEQISVPGTYYRFVSAGTFVPTVGQVPTFSGSPISTFRVPLDEFEVAASAGMYQVGDYRYLIEAAQIGYKAITLDRIYDEGLRFVVDVQRDPIQGSVFFSIVARDVGQSSI
mgnify:CR=1 FL=1